MFYEDGDSLPFTVLPAEWGDNDGALRTRNVMDLRLSELVPTNRPHRSREPVVIDGETIHETLRERLARESREIEIAVTQLANQLARRTAQLEHLKRFPEVDPFEDGTVIQFEKSFPGAPNDTYSYVAHRVDGRWYLSGARSPQGITWDRLVNWMGLGVETVYQLNAQGTRGGRKKVIG